jgi:two-component system, NtrC family, response regulator GlrR
VTATETATDLLIGTSPAFREAVALIDRIARYDVPVVIEGETGTGKELAARAIHYGSDRRDRAFVPVNCGALPETLIENELFGHQRGAFTDAHAALPGLVEVAHRGTLFLDEVDALSPRGQVTLLRFLQDQTYRPLGARVDRQCDVRVVAASNRSLDSLVEAGSFRADLLFRLKLMCVPLPPLRARTGDATLLAHYFVECLNRRYRRTAKHVGAALRAWLESQRWPGNVRELENLIHRLHLLSDRAELQPPEVDHGGAHVHVNVLADPQPAPADRESAPASDRAPACESLNYRTAKIAALAEFDRRFLHTLLERTRGNVTAAAKVACKERRALGKLIRKYGLRPELFKTA